MTRHFVCADICAVVASRLCFTGRHYTFITDRDVKKYTHKCNSWLRGVKLIASDSSVACMEDCCKYKQILRNSNSASHARTVKNEICQFFFTAKQKMQAQLSLCVKLFNYFQ